MPPPARDAASDASDAVLEDAGLVPPYPMRCASETVAGFRALDGGWFRPCNCFDGAPLRPVVTRFDEGLRTVPFDCSWPEGMIFQRGSTSSGPALVDAVGCEYVEESGRGEGFVPAPYEERFIAPQERPDGVRSDRICVPTECVFDVPGQPARCSDDCAGLGSDGLEPVTVYRVDRSACEP